LAASFQVPHRLGWKKDLQSLMPFNRKLLWVQSAFTALTIIAFGVLTLALHAELLRGDRAALGLACFVGLCWTAQTHLRRRAHLAHIPVFSIGGDLSGIGNLAPVKSRG